MLCAKLTAALMHLAALCERQTELTPSLHQAAMVAFNITSDLTPPTAVEDSTLASLEIRSLTDATLACLDSAIATCVDLHELGAVSEARTVLADALSP